MSEPMPKPLSKPTPMRIIGLAGWSGAGKTTLLTKVIPVLVRRGLKVATVKHAHHEFDIDRPGKDSWLHREAGASEVAIVSSRRWALMHELRDEPEPPLMEILAKLSPVDLVIVEGFKRHAHPKLEVYRAAAGKPLHLSRRRLRRGDRHRRAFAAGATAGADARRCRKHRQCLAGRGAAVRSNRGGAGERVSARRSDGFKCPDAAPPCDRLRRPRRAC